MLYGYFVAYPISFFFSLILLWQAVTFRSPQRHPSTLSALTVFTRRTHVHEGKDVCGALEN